MTVYELNEDQKTQLKQNYLCMNNESVSWYELAEANSIIPDEVIFTEYAGIDFTEDDFS